MENLRYLEGVSSLRLDQTSCIGCGMCEEVCPHGVLGVEDRKARLLDLDACMECGACARNCPVGALAVSAGVGCASAIIKSWVTGRAPACGCEDGCC